MPRLLSRPFHAVLLVANAFLAMHTASAADPAVKDLVGEYNLGSSITAPPSSWGYTKARLSVRKLDDKHVIMLLACEWKDEPKAICADYYYAEQRRASVYLQDMNTDGLHLYFDPSTRRLTMVSLASDANGSVRHDVYVPTTTPLTEPALVRRMKREQANSESKETLRVFGPYSKWTYQHNRIDFHNPPQ